MINKDKIKKWVKEDLIVKQGDIDKAIELTINKVLSEIKRKCYLKEKLVEFHKALIDITNRKYELGYYGKLGEPDICIGISDEGKWYAEIFSYILDFGDGGRHHYFKAETCEELIEIIQKNIDLEYQILEKEEEKEKEFLLK